MEWFVTIGTFEQAVELVCYFCTLIAVFLSYLFTLRF